ncbi:MAG: tetratricopeptide repeat protein [Chthoniobacterales bacterium]
MKFRTLTCALLALAAVSALHAETADNVAQANQEYQAEHFPEAAALYQKAIDAGTRNAAVFYDLGNAWFRAGDAGQAILNYERALALRPQHPEARANLHVARDKARALELRPQWWDEFIARITPNQFSIAAASVFWVLAFAVAAWLFAPRRAPLLLALALLSALVLGSLVAGLYALETGNNGRDLAIVIAAKTEARVATADSAGSVLVLPPGSEIRILSTRGDWIYAALPNDLRGWLPALSAQRVRL